jgi:hypothetical protein
VGILDQNKQWDFMVHAPEQACVAAFQSAFLKGGLLRSAKWRFGVENDGATSYYQVAVFKGRAGLGGLLNSMSKRGSEQSRAAIGSTIAFSTAEVPGGSRCSMWLKSATTQMGFKNEASLLRHYMRAVESELRKLDPQMQLSKA